MNRQTDDDDGGRMKERTVTNTLQNERRMVTRGRKDGRKGKINRTILLPFYL